MWQVGEIRGGDELIYPVAEVDKNIYVHVYKRAGGALELISISNGDGSYSELDWVDFYQFYDSLTAIKAWKEGRTK